MMLKVPRMNQVMSGWNGLRNQVLITTEPAKKNGNSGQNKSVTKNGVSSNGFALMHIGVILFEEHNARTDSGG